MADFFGKFKSNKQEWATPINLFNKLNAADDTNKKCDCFFNKENDALKQKWTGCCWLNPPYGNKEYKLENWIKKAYNESNENDCTVVMLIPSRTNTKWWHTYCMKSAEVRFINGRPKFGDAKHGLPQPLAIVVFKKHIGDTIFKSFNL